MSRSAIKHYCQTTLALLDIPVPSTVLTQRPKEISVGEQTVLVVTVPHSKEARFTLSRGAGRKQIVHQVQIDLYWVAADEQTGGQAFDDLLEQLDSLFRAVTIPADITDPDSGAASVILWIGEEIETAVAEPLLDESLGGLVVFTATKLLIVTEHLTG